MGLRSRLISWLLEDLEGEVRQARLEIRELNDRLTRLEARLEEQDKVIQKVLFDLNRKADKGLYYELSERLEVARDEIKAMETELSSLWDKVKFIEFSFSEHSEEPEMTVEELASIVEHYIRKGLTRPSELKKAVGVSWEKLYAALTYLKLKKRIARIQKGRKVEYILVKESEE